MYPLGLVVFSKSGRDKRKPFLVVSTMSEKNSDYWFLADGHLRKLDKPKKKKLMHVQPTKFIAEHIQQKLANKEPILDAEIRKALLPFIKEKGVAELVER